MNRFFVKKTFSCMGYFYVMDRESVEKLGNKSPCVKSFFGGTPKAFEIAKKQSEAYCNELNNKDEMDKRQSRLNKALSGKGMC